MVPSMTQILLKYHTVAPERLVAVTLRDLAASGIPERALGKVSKSLRVTLVGCVALNDHARSYLPAALGGTAELSNLDGTQVTVNIPPGTQPNTAFTMEGIGVPYVDGGGRGNLLAVARVEVPRRMSAKARKALEEFATALKALSTMSLDDEEGIGRSVKAGEDHKEALRLTDDQADRLVASLDRNSDGVIDYDEFLSALQASALIATDDL